jgi:IS30 family transposase
MTKRKKAARNGKPKTAMEDPILSYGEVARQLGKTHQTVMRWVRDGLFDMNNVLRMPSGMPGIRQSEVNKFLRGTAIETRVQAPSE